MDKFIRCIEYCFHGIAAISAVVLVAGFAYSLWYSITPEGMQRQETERILRSEGVVIEKVADPAGYDFGFWEGGIVYRPDRYYLKVRLDNGSITEMKVDAVTYMHTNVGDRVKNR
nr:MAG TPA: Protein of unknown function (DUF2500) [Caudoviricetes sp.]